jgi:hypothetical protein
MGLGFRGLGAKKNRKNFGEESSKRKKRENMTDTVRPPPSATTTMNNNNNDPIIASTTSAPGPDDVVAVAALIDELKVRLLSFFFLIFRFRIDCFSLLLSDPIYTKNVTFGKKERGSLLPR